MLDNELIALFRPIITAGLVSYGFADVDVIQFNQPTQQGTPLKNTIYFQKLFDHRYGFMGVHEIYDELNTRVIRTQIQNYETTFQIQALAIQDPANTSAPTASDLVNIVSDVLQLQSTIETLQASHVGILRITDVVNPYFIDDKDRFEATPSFSFTLTHTHTNISYQPFIDSVAIKIYKVP